MSSESAPEKCAYPEWWTDETIAKWEAAKPRLEYKWKGVVLQIQHHIEQYKQEWERRIGTTFPGADLDSLIGMASWAGLSEEELAGLNAWEIVRTTIEVLEARGDVAEHVKTRNKATNAAERALRLTFLSETAVRPLPRVLSISQAAASLAIDLSTLPILASNDDVRSTHHCVVRIIALLDRGGVEVRHDAYKFAAVGSVGDVVPVRGIPYSSAHEAAFAEAYQIALSLWRELEPEGRTAFHEAVLERIADEIAQGKADEEVDFADPMMRMHVNETGLDPNLIVKHWPRAKAVILDVCDDEWRRDIAPIASRINREAATVETTSGDEPPAPTKAAALASEHRSAPMTKADMARRITGRSNARFREIEAFISQHDLQRVGDNNKWTVRLDGMDANTRSKLEKP